MKRKITILSLFVCLLFFNTKAQTVLLTEDFTSAGAPSTAPSGWVIEQYYTTSVATDSWRFDNPGFRSPGGNFSGNFAIFDGDNYSLNATFENIGLVSKEFSTQGHDTVYVAFDTYLITGVATTGVIEAYNGESWEIIRTYNVSSGSRDTVDISRVSRNLCNAKIRFRWQSNDGGHWAIDNIVVFTASAPKSLNAQMISMVNPKPQGCANSAAILTVKVKNAGTSNISNLPIKAQIFDGNSTQTRNITISSLPTCKDTVVSFSSTIDISFDVPYTFTINSELIGDQVRFNSDTILITNFRNLKSPTFTNAKDTTFCGANKSFTDSVNVLTGETAFWFTDSLSNTDVRRGKSFPFGLVNKDTVVFVEKATVSNFKHPQINVNPTVGYNAINSGLFLNLIAKTDLYLDSLEVTGRSAVNTDYGYEVFVRSGSYQNFVSTSSGWNKNYSDTVTYLGANTKIFVGSIFVKAGDTLGLCLLNTTANTLSFASGAPIIMENSQIKSFSTDVFPNAPFNNATLTAFGYGGSFYYSVVCKTGKTRRAFRPVESPNGSQFQISTPFTAIPGFPRDIARERDTLTYELTTPNGYTNASFGTDWTISELSMATINGTPIPSTDTTILSYPGLSGNGKLRYIPRMGWADSTVRINVVLKDLRNSLGCDSSFSKEIFIAPTPKTNFNFSLACERGETVFTNNSTISSGSMTYKWYFGTTDSSTDANPKHIFSSAGNYLVRLRATSNLGIAKDTSLTVVVRESPIATFTASNGCLGQNVTFTNNTNYKPSGCINNCFTSFWKFGDGGVSNSNSPTYQYSAVNTYNPRLIVTAANGCKDSLEAPITIYQTPKANFVESNNNVCAGSIIVFTNTSTISGGTFTSGWDFGTGTTASTLNASHKFDSSGTFAVRLVATSNNGCVDTLIKNIVIKESPYANFEWDKACDIDPTQFVNKTISHNGFTTLYEWNFNGQGSSQLENPSFNFTSTGNKNVSLKATIQENGCNNTVTKVINIRVMAKANFNFVEVCAGQQLKFNNSSQSSTDFVNYSWKFGDGNSSTQKNPSHTYSNTKGETYQVTLVASVSGGCVDSITKPVYSKEVPDCDFEIVDTYLPGHRAYKFVPAVKNHSTYSWDFGDGNKSNDSMPTYQYNKNGTFFVELSVVNFDGCTCKKRIEHEVLNLNLNKNLAESGLEIFPNPTNGTFVIRNNKAIVINKIEVTNLLGATLFEEVVANRNLNHPVTLDGLAVGVYNLRITSGETVFVQKLIIQ
jgi:PKD repeat protein